MKAKFLAGFTVLILLIAAFASIRPAAAQRNGRHGNYFPNIELTTQDGKKVHFYDDLLKGKIVAITLIYTHCKDACPLETARMRQVQKMLGDHMGKDIHFVSISIDPENDTPEVLHDYAEMYNAGPGWTFLTGKKDDITALSKKLGLYTDPDPALRDGHTPSLLIGNEVTGEWKQQSAGDNPRFLAIQMLQLGGFPLDGVVDHKQVEAQMPKKLDKGAYLFGKDCAACHSIGGGDKVGPDLQGVANVRTEKWLREFITAPDKKIDEEKDPIAVALYERYKHLRMPNLALIPEDIDSIIKFLKTQDGSQHHATAAGTPQAANSSAAQPGSASVKADK